VDYCETFFSSVLSQDGTQNKTQISDERLDFCGANFCPNGDLSISNVTEISGPVLERPPTDQIHFLMYIFLGFAILASIIIAVFVDPIREYEMYSGFFLRHIVITFYFFFQIDH